MIGNLGELITFEVSTETVLTFTNLQRTTSGRWANHEVIGRKPVAEFLGPGLSPMTFEIYLTVMHGISPRRTIDRIDSAVENGIPLRFVLGGKSIGSYKWVITNASETWNEILQGGLLVSARMKLTLSEYFEEKQKNTVLKQVVG